MSSRVIGTFLRDALSQPQEQIVYGEVSRSQPVPVSFASPLCVVIPDWSSDYFWTIPAGHWGADNGATLPAAGAACLLIFDNQGALWCARWVGPHT